MSKPGYTEPTILESSLTPLIQHFNDHLGKVRFITLLSPT
jgi:hypothetical protein